MQGSWKGGEGCVREAGGSCERSSGKGAGGAGGLWPRCVGGSVRGKLFVL